MTVLHLEICTGLELQSLLDEAIEQGTRITPEDVIALWKDLQKIPGVDNHIVFLEFGRQKINLETGQPILDEKNSGCGYIHILAKHEEHFVKNEVSHVFNHLNEMLENSLRYQHGSMVLYATRTTNKLFATCIRVAQNGFLSTAHPVSDKSVLELLARELPSSTDSDESTDDMSDDEYDCNSSEKCKTFSLVPYATTSFIVDGQYAIPEDYLKDRALIQDINDLTNRYNFLIEQVEGERQRQILCALLDLRVASTAYRLRNVTGCSTSFYLEGKLVPAIGTNVRRIYRKVRPSLFGTPLESSILDNDIDSTLSSLQEPTTSSPIKGCRTSVV